MCPITISKDNISSAGSQNVALCLPWRIQVRQIAPPWHQNTYQSHSCDRRSTFQIQGAAGNRKEKGAALLRVVTRCSVKRCILLLALVKWFSIPLIHMLDTTPETQEARGERESERRRRLHASFRVGHRAVTAITKINMQHSQRKKKKQATTHNSSSTAGRRFRFWAPQLQEPTSYIFIFCNPRQSRCVMVAVAFSHDASVSDVNIENYTWEECAVIHGLWYTTLSYRVCFPHIHRIYRIHVELTPLCLILCSSIIACDASVVGFALHGQRWQKRLHGEGVSIVLVFSLLKGVKGSGLTATVSPGQQWEMRETGSSAADAESGLADFMLPSAREYLQGGKTDGLE